MDAQSGSTGLTEFRAELHVHTVLSPCADVEMIPPLIVRTALDRKLQIIAVTDHNASANVQAVQRAAAGTKLTVLPGLELQTLEEVHLLCLFADSEALLDFQAGIDLLMPERKNDAEFFGEQFIVDETGDFVAREERLLLNSCRIEFGDAVRLVQSLGGLAIPAHVDRRAYGLYTNLGFLPADITVDAVEISRHTTVPAMIAEHPELAGIPLLQGGDVHYLDDFLGANLFRLASPTVEEIRLALAGDQGRSCQIDRYAVDKLQQDV